MATKNPKVEWDAETGTATCIIYSNDTVYTGIASCHPTDADMCSEKTGCTIAYHRALIRALCGERDNVIKPKLAALKQLYYSMSRSKRFNPKSYESVMLTRQINLYETDLANFNEQITSQRQQLRQYITDKDQFYQSIRKMRKAENK